MNLNFVYRSTNYTYNILHNKYLSSHLIANLELFRLPESYPDPSIGFLQNLIGLAQC